MLLFKPKTPPKIHGIDLHLGSVSQMLSKLCEDGQKSPLIIADPPWSYDNAPGNMNPGKSRFISETGAPVYATTTMEEIAEVLKTTEKIAAPGARLVVWCTFPQLGDWMEAHNAIKPWSYVTGGAWHKAGLGGGMGWHWLGRTEPVLIYRNKGKLINRWDQLKNSHISTPGKHSEKPWPWMAEWLRRWTNPGDLVVDIYAGLGPLARACYATGRRYIGAEICPDRHHLAMCKLTEFKTQQME